MLQLDAQRGTTSPNGALCAFASLITVRVEADKRDAIRPRGGIVQEGQKALFAALDEAKENGAVWPG
jgi:hypothetical protein